MTASIGRRTALSLPLAALAARPAALARNRKSHSGSAR